MEQVEAEYVYKPIWVVHLGFQNGKLAHVPHMVQVVKRAEVSPLLVNERLLLSAYSEGMDSVLCNFATEGSLPSDFYDALQWVTLLHHFPLESH